MPEEAIKDVYHLPGTTWCLECEKECETHTIDLGIGSYEMGNWSYYDTEEREASECCDAEFTEKTPYERTL